jgi:hypothetical protein
MPDAVNPCLSDGVGLHTPVISHIAVWIVSDCRQDSTIMLSTGIGRVRCCWILRSNRTLPDVRDAEIRSGSEAVRADCT